MPTCAVKEILFNESGEILLLKRKLCIYDILNWDLPDGLIENGETEDVALAREI